MPSALTGLGVGLRIDDFTGQAVGEGLKLLLEGWASPRVHGRTQWRRVKAWSPVREAATGAARLSRDRENP